MSTITEKLSDFTINLEFGDLPDEAVETAKNLLFDSIGCALGGLKQEDPGIYMEVLDFLGADEQATILGTRKKTSIANAALINSLLVRVMDYNDIYWNQDPSHPSDLIPVALALGEHLDLRGREILLAVIIGYEIEMRLCDFAVPGIRERGWHHATLTQLASPFMAGKLLGLNKAQMVNAAGISGSSQCTLGAVTAGKLTMMKNTVDPSAAAGGITAALLAQKGYTGPEHVIDGKEGLMQVLGQGWDEKALLGGLGESFKITECGMKSYPTEALTHSSITAALEIVKKHNIDPNNIAGVHVGTIARAADILSDPSKYDPKSKETADHSLPYCLAAAFARGRVTPNEFTNETINDPSVRKLLPLIKIEADPAFESLFPEKQPSNVTVTTASGENFDCYVEYPKGHPRNPMDKRELLSKFTSLASPELGPEESGRVFDFIAEIQDLVCIDRLFDILAPD